MNKRTIYIVLAAVFFSVLLALAWSAPDLPSTIDRTQRSLNESRRIDIYLFFSASVQ